MNEQASNQSSDAEKDHHEKHDVALKLTEEALDAYVEGDEKKGDAIVQKAKQTDSSAVEEVIHDLDEDAGSDHSVPKENQ